MHLSRVNMHLRLRVALQVVELHALVTELAVRAHLG
jgi:hypothetical protein